MRYRLAIILLLCALCPLGCSSDPANNSTATRSGNVVRVRVFENVDTVGVIADRPVVRIGATAIGVAFQPGPAVRVVYGASGSFSDYFWRECAVRMERRF